MSRYYPNPYRVVQIPRSYDPTNKDGHGNPRLDIGDPIVRTVQSIQQRGRRGSSHKVISADVVDRSETDIMIAVDDPTLYSEQDQVILNPTIIDDEYVTGSGTAYWVDGVPSDDRSGPWPKYDRLFGGLVRLRRVT